MKGRRWNDQEDALLKKTVLHSIRNGETQLTAFAEVGQEIGRTPGACGFRWNAVIRQQDPISYKDAKKKRVYNQLQEKRALPVQSLLQATMGLQQLMDVSQEIKQNIRDLEQQLHEAQRKCEALKMERVQMQEQNYSFTDYQDEIKAKYQDLLQVIQRMEQPSHQSQGEDFNHKRKQTMVDTDIESLT